MNKDKTAAKVIVFGISRRAVQAFVDDLPADYYVIEWRDGEGQRGEPGGADHESFHADLFSLAEAERALEGAAYAVYAVPSVLSSARLTQGKPEDLHVILADNFARAAKKAGVEQILYVERPLEGGAERLDLESRATLSAHGVPVTVISSTAQEESVEQLSSSVVHSNTVRSVQRFLLPKGQNAAWVAAAYARWLSDIMKPIIRVHQAEEKLCFLLWGIKKPLLELTYSTERSTPDRVLYYITGGMLARTDDSPGRGRLEFREVLSGTHVIVAIHDFIPKLPWLLYRGTQALIHLAVMHAYGRFLQRSQKEGKG